MATKSTISVTWSASGSLSVSAGGTGTSDAVSINDDAEVLSLLCIANNNGTPADGDEIEWRVLHSYDGGTDYETPENKSPSAVVDTDDADPAKRSIPVDVAATHFKLHATNNASSNAITVSAEGKEIKTS